MSTRTAGITGITIAGTLRPVRGYARLTEQVTQKEPIYGLSGYQGYVEVPTPSMAEVSSTLMGGDNGEYIAQLNNLGTAGRKDNVVFTFANGDQKILQNAHLQGQATTDSGTGEITFTLFGESVVTV